MEAALNEDSKINNSNPPSVPERSNDCKEDEGLIRKVELTNPLTAQQKGDTDRNEIQRVFADGGKNDNLQPCQEEDPEFDNAKKFDELTKVNQFSIRKRVAQGMIDLALFAANISQLRIIIKAGSETVEFYHFLLVCISLSLICQIGFSLLILFLWDRKKRRKSAWTAGNRSGTEGNSGDKLYNTLNCISVFIVLSVTITNVCISGFGIEFMN